MVTQILVLRAEQLSHPFFIQSRSHQAQMLMRGALSTVLPGRLPTPLKSVSSSGRAVSSWTKRVVRFWNVLDCARACVLGQDRLLHILPGSMLSCIQGREAHSLQPVLDIVGTGLQLGVQMACYPLSLNPELCEIRHHTTVSLPSPDHRAKC